MSSVNLHVDRIVVHGMPPTCGRHLAMALEEKLRQWAESGLAGTVPGNAPRAIPSIDAGRSPLGATPAQAAGQIVQAIQTRLDARAAASSNLGTRSRYV
jgi:hypothetical protein